MEPFHQLPGQIVLDREAYRQQHAALEVALDVLDRFPTADPDGELRAVVEVALRGLLQRIWPFLDDLDEED